jgi:hypothetical protein
VPGVARSLKYANDIINARKEKGHLANICGMALLEIEQEKNKLERTLLELDY